MSSTHVSPKSAESSATPVPGAASAESSWRIRPARPGDEAALLELIRALAVYEREPDAVATTIPDLTAALFPPEAAAARAHAFVAEWDQPSPSGGPLVFGMAVWFVSFSTWTGRHGIWLEDLFVDPSARGLGAGRALLEELAQECRRRGYARLDWAVLDWNAPAQGFYRSLGARPLDEWTSWRLDGEDLRKLGTVSSPVQTEGHSDPIARPRTTDVDPGNPS
jgi:GNAT superfamily N-acetyltransferase